MASKKQLKLSERITITMALQLIAITMTAITVSYFHIYSIVSSLVESDLQKYVVERGERESEVFRLAKKNQVILADRLVKSLADAGTKEDRRYSEIFAVSSDGATREKTEINNQEHPGFFIPKFVKIDQQIRRRAVVLYDFMDHECF